MKTNLFFILCCVLLFTGCKKKKTNETYFKGELTILTDESFKSVTEALAEGYMIQYPESKIKVEVKKEDLGFVDLLNKKAKVIVMSRELNEKERNEYERQSELKYLPAKFAADGLVFIVPKNSTRTSISLEEIENGLLNPSKQFIFDGTNSSNLNFIAEKFKKAPSQLQFSIISGNENVIDEISKFPDKIGVIGLNTISRPYDKKSEELRDKIKILPVVVNGKSILPEPQNFENMVYPFTRVLYFLSNESGTTMGNGFIRYSCTHIGQKVVAKEGLQPYNMYKREVEMK